MQKLERPLKIAVIGWYNRLNAGDDRLQHSFLHLFKDHNLSFINLWTMPPPLELLGAQDWIFIGGGGLFIRQELGLISCIMNWHPKVKAHFAVIGVSARGIEHHPGTLDYLFEKSQMFHVRDQFSKKALGSNDHIEIHPDLSFMTPFEPSPQAGKGVVICLPENIGAESCDWSHLKELSEEEPLLGLPFYELKDLDKNCLLTVTDKVAHSFDISILAHCELALCGRFHGVLFAVQLAKPFLAFDCAPKIVNFCQDNQLDDLIIKSNDIQQIREKLKYIRENRKSIVERIHQVREKNISQSHAQKQNILQLVQNTPLNQYSLLQRAKHRLARNIW